jgi:hypothetical protein
VVGASVGLLVGSLVGVAVGGFVGRFVGARVGVTCTQIMAEKIYAADARVSERWQKRTQWS